MTVVRNQDGRLEVFARGQDTRLWHSWQRHEGGWSQWEPLADGGLENDWHRPLGTFPTVGQNHDGRLETIVIASDGRSPVHSWQHEPNGDWAKWQSLEGWSVRALGPGFREF
ncbi:hypothetical protein ACIBK9_24045 [Nonomuraea sp. NPDC050227]|uniref:hypothetical protein n=1 Tax=Nonomuraea sp. NPDC050227 TaxID=3364360 RepID=UPI00379A1EE1